MQDSKNTDQLEIFKSYNNFSAFIHAMTTFIISYFDRNSFTEKTEVTSLHAEEQVTQSLILLEKLHMFLFVSFTIYNKFFHLSKEKHPFFNQANLELLEKLQDFIILHDYLKPENRVICEKSIFQILTYYYSAKYYFHHVQNTQSDSVDDSSIVTFTLSPLPPPWLNTQQSTII